MAYEEVLEERLLGDEELKGLDDDRDEILQEGDTEGLHEK